MEDKNLPARQQYISTPFAYTKFSKNLTLLQQSVLVKVSEHIQDYMKSYFGSDLRKSKDVPRPLFSAADKNNGMPEFHVDYAELGVSINNYSLVHEKVKEVLALTVDAPGVDKDGNPAIIKYNIFTESNMSSEAKNGVVFSLNPKVVDYVFDMSQGYVRHPVDIARLAMVERMPMIYYYLQKKSECWKNRVLYLTVKEIKGYLGMLARPASASDDKGRGRPTKDKEIKEQYPKFSQFQKNVLDKSVADINRLTKEGPFDIFVSYEPIYNGKRKVGNPAFIKFCIYDTFEEMQKASGVMEPTLQFVEMSVEEAIWKDFLNEYDGKAKDILNNMEYVRVTDEGHIVLRTSESDMHALERCLQTMSMEEKQMLLALWSKHCGRAVTGIKYQSR